MHKENKGMVDGMPLSFGSFLMRVWHLCTRYPIVVFGPIMVWYAILAFGRYYGIDWITGSASLWVGNVSYAFLYYAFYLTIWLGVLGYVFLALRELVHGNEVDYNAVFSRLVRRLPISLLVTCITLVAFVIGYFIFILPGVIVLFFLIFAPFIALASKKGVVQSLTHSTRLVLFHNRFFVFLLVVGLALVATFLTSAILGTVTIWMTDGTGDAVNEVARFVLLLLNIVFTTLYHGIMIAGITILYVSFNEQYKQAPLEVRQQETKIGCVGYGCMGFFAFILVFVVIGGLALYRFSAEFGTDLVKDYHVNGDIFENMTDEESGALDAFVQEYHTELASGGTLVIDETLANAMAKKVFETLGYADVVLSGDQAMMAIGLSLERMFGEMFSGKYIDASATFTMVMQNDIATISVLTGFVGETKIMNNFIGDTSFFWSDASTDIDRRIAGPRATVDVEGELNRVQALELTGSVIRVELLGKE